MHALRDYYDVIKIVKSDSVDLDYICSILTVNEMILYTEKIASKKNNWLLGRFVAKLALQDYFYQSVGADFELTSLEILSTKSGAPIIEINFESNLYSNLDIPLISISHTKEKLAVARVTSPQGSVGVGIDVEFVREFEDSLKIKFMTENEYNYIHSQDQDKQAVLSTAAWTLKESYLKALGIGLKRHPQSVDVLPLLENYFSKGLIDRGSGWMFFESEYVIGTVLLSNN